MAASGPDAKKAAGAASPAVRFASVNEEIAPAETLQSLDSLSTPAAGDADAAGGAQQLKQLSESLQGTHLQERRMSHFAFEPVSLPVSRVRLFPPFHCRLLVLWTLLSGRLYLCPDVDNALSLYYRATIWITKPKENHLVHRVHCALVDIWGPAVLSRNSRALAGHTLSISLICLPHPKTPPSICMTYET
jgi:hypothetical protein